MSCSECSEPVAGTCTACKREFCGTHGGITDIGWLCHGCVRRINRRLTWALRGCVVGAVVVFVTLVVWNILVW